VEFTFALVSEEELVLIVSKWKGPTESLKWIRKWKRCWRSSGLY